MSKRILVVSSGGGHWAELCRLMPALEGLDVTFASVRPEYAAQLAGRPYRLVPDFHRLDLKAAPLAVWTMARLLLELRPHIVLSTGAAPGLLALALGKWLLGARTIWIDSLASSETLSGSGRVARFVSDSWLTQWPHLARPNGPHFWGAVL
ncbi:MAG: glucuronosyltransferase [Devosia sp.]|nr:glucuronosyltransferase [Devosia sp.]